MQLLQRASAHDTGPSAPLDEVVAELLRPPYIWLIAGVLVVQELGPWYWFGAAAVVVGLMARHASRSVRRRTLGRRESA